MKHSFRNFQILFFFFSIILLSFAYPAEEAQSAGARVSKGTIMGPMDFLSAAKMASYTGDATEKDICLSLGNFANDPAWRLGGAGNSITYAGSSNPVISFIVVCDRGDRMLDTIRNNPSTGMSQSYVSHCRQFSESSSEVKCAVILNSVVAPEAVKTVKSEENPFAYIVLISFAIILVLPMILVLTSPDFLMKIIYLIKMLLFIATLILFNFFGSRENTFFNLLVLATMFLQANLSFSPFLLGILGKEERRIKLANFAILGIEFTLLFFILAIIWNSGAFSN